VQQNLTRLQLHAQLRTADACEPASWWDGVCFDRILVDAPCSASGIVRRHPDVRWLRKRGDIATLCRLQRRLLEALWPLLKPGGKLLYSTCSVFRAEGARMVAAFTSAHADSAAQPLYWNWTTGMSSSPSQARAANAGAVSTITQLLPTASINAATRAPGLLRDHDGFFYALIEKRT
jgi:16S rRNA (cytosine967-C5)-methyltransferase